MELFSILPISQKSRKPWPVIVPSVPGKVNFISALSQVTVIAAHISEGYLWVFPGAGEFKIVKGEDALVDYEFANKTMAHRVIPSSQFRANRPVTDHTF